MEIRAGERIGRYELERRLGAGGLGEVWSARLTGPMGFTRRVAIKLIRLDQAADPQRAEQLSRLLINEARICGLLNHPNVVPVTDFGEQDGMFFAVQEFVAGMNLRELLDSSPVGGELPLDVVLEIGRQVAAGLAHAHALRGDDGAALGVVHRDIKPENLMVTPDGLVRVLDFGIARSLSNVERTATGEGVIRGTMAYMAPEQIDTEMVVDARTDLYALGLVLYELVTRRRLYRESAVLPLIQEILHRDRTADLAVLAQAAPALRPLIEQLLARVPGDRPESADAVEARLLTLLAGRSGNAGLRATMAAAWTAPGAPPTPARGSGDTIGPTEDVPAPLPAPAPPPPPAPGRRPRPVALFVAALVVLVVLAAWRLVSNRDTVAGGQRELVLLGLSMPGEDAPVARWALLHHLDALAARLDPVVGEGFDLPDSVLLDGRVLNGGAIEWLAARRSDGLPIADGVLAAAAVPPAPALSWSGGITAAFGRVPVNRDVYYSAVASVAAADGAALPELPEFDGEAGGFFAKELYFCLPDSVRHGPWRFRAELEWQVVDGAWGLSALRAIRPEAFITTQRWWSDGAAQLESLEQCLAARPWPPAPAALNGRRVVTTLLVGGLGPEPARTHPEHVAHEADLPVSPSSLRFQTVDLQLRYSAAPTGQVLTAVTAFERALPRLAACEGGLLGAAGVHEWRLRGRVRLDSTGVEVSTTSAGRPVSSWRTLTPADLPPQDAVRACIDARLRAVQWPEVDRLTVIDAIGVFGPPPAILGPVGSVSQEEATVALTMAIRPRQSVMVDCLAARAEERGVQGALRPAPYIEVGPTGSVEHAAFAWGDSQPSDAELGCAHAVVDGLALPATGYRVVINPAGVQRPEVVPELTDEERELLDEALAPTIRDAMRSGSSAFKACWEGEVDTDGDPQEARIWASFNLSPGGSLEGLQLESKGASDLSRLTDCFAGVLLDIEFPPSGHGGLEVASYPWILSWR